MRIRFLFPIAIFFLIASTSAQSPIPGQLPRQGMGGGTIFRCLFDRSFDLENGDGWPDRWTRKRGIDQGIPFPAHIDFGMVENRNPFSNYSMRASLNGGGVAGFTPKLPIRSGMCYTAGVYVDAVGLVFDDAYLLMSFYGDSNTTPLKTVSSERVRNTNGWMPLEIGPILADMPGVKYVSLGLLVIPTSRQDFGATVDFTNLELRESPAVSLSMLNKNHLFFDPREIDAACRLAGVDPTQRTVQFTLEDPFGKVIARREAEMMIGNRPADQFVVPPQSAEAVFQGQASWKNLPIRSPGFYRIRVSTPKEYVQSLKLPKGVFFSDPLRDVPPLTFAVVQPISFVADGEFGWNLEGWTLDEIRDNRSLLMQSGISRLKIPAWLPENVSREERQRLVDFCEEMIRRQVRITGLMTPPPKAVRDKIKLGSVNAATIFSLDPKDWMPTMEQTLQDLSLLIRDWQWTGDGDFSITEIPFFRKRIVELRQAFDKEQLGLGIGFAWNWEEELPESFFPAPLPAGEIRENPGNSGPGNSGSENPETKTKLSTAPSLPVSEFVSLASTSPFTPDELAAYLQSVRSSHVRRSVSLTPLSDRLYSLEDRVVDLVRKMIVAKRNGADSLFLAKPFEDRTGVFKADGTPTELFLPWRTTSSYVSGKPFLGSVRLPNRSENYCFDLGGGESAMIVWNGTATSDKPVQETLYLGKAPEIVDLWGRRRPAEPQGDLHVVPVGPVPCFVIGLDTDIVRFRLGFQLLKKDLSSYPNQPMPIPFSFKNNSNHPFSAQISPAGPRPGDWKVLPPTQAIALEPGETGNGSFSLTLASGANTGRQPIRIDIKLAGASPCEFSVYDDLFFGEKEISMEFSSRLNRDGELEVAQAFVNDGDKQYTYSCKLFAKDRAFQQAYVSKQGSGRIEHVYKIPKGRELLKEGVREVNVSARGIGGGQPMFYTVPIDVNVEPDLNE